MIKCAREFARKNVGLLKDIVSSDAPLVGIEPSAILSFRDEYPDLVGEDLKVEALALAQNTLLYDEFIMREVDAGRISSESFRISLLILNFMAIAIKRQLLLRSFQEKCSLCQ
jgi:hypothetical protein